MENKELIKEQAIDLVNLNSKIKEFSVNARENDGKYCISVNFIVDQCSNCYLINLDKLIDGKFESINTLTLYDNPECTCQSWINTRGRITYIVGKISESQKRIYANLTSDISLNSTYKLQIGVDNQEYVISFDVEDLDGTVRFKATKSSSDE